MVDKVFISYEDSYKYVQSHKGIYGSEQYKNPQSYSTDIEKHFNGYSIKEFKVFEFNSLAQMEKEELKQKALNKLSKEEKQILGL